MSELRLEGRVALVTGASSGLGAHFARVLAEAGARVVVAARRLDRVSALASELGEGVGLAVAMDVSDEASVIAAFDAAEAKFGAVDTVIANAGVSLASRATDTPAKDLSATFATNLTGVFLTAREGARRMIAQGSRESGHGRIVLIGSITADHASPGNAAYCASKAGVAALTKNFALEWVRMGVNVNAIQPGYIKTELAGDWFDTDKGRELIASFPRKRLQPVESLDSLLLYLASDASAAMTGSVITLDDGQSL